MTTPEVVVVQDAGQEQQTQPRPHMRWLIRRDMPEVLDIEQASFKEPWSENDFLVHISKHNCIGMVVEVGEKVVAFFIYMLEKNHIYLLNLAVHPDYRGQGIGEQCILKLQTKISPDRRARLVALVPESCLKIESFFKKYEINVEVQPTQTKGEVAYTPVLSVMTRKDVGDTQEVENEFMSNYGKDPRNIGKMLTTYLRYGIVARDKHTDELFGYVLYAREQSGIDVNGEYGLIVRPKARGRDIGRMLMMELVNQKLPITVSDINLFCEDQVDFLRAIGVPVPKVKSFVTVKWEPPAVSEKSKR